MEQQSTPRTEPVLNSESFAMEVERRIFNGEDDSYISATADLIEDMDCEPEEVLHLLSKTLIAKIEAEAHRKGYMKEKIDTVDLSALFAAD